MSSVKAGNGLRYLILDPGSGICITLRILRDVSLEVTMENTYRELFSQVVLPMLASSLTKSLISPVASLEVGFSSIKLMWLA